MLDGDRAVLGQARPPGHARHGAPNYVIADNFFQGAFGGSFLNHQFLIAAAAPQWPGGADKSGATTGCGSGQANCDLHSVVDTNGMPKGYDLYKPTIARPSSTRRRRSTTRRTTRRRS